MAATKPTKYLTLQTTHLINHTPNYSCLSPCNPPQPTLASQTTLGGAFPHVTDSTAHPMACLPVHLSIHLPSAPFTRTAGSGKGGMDSWWMGTPDVACCISCVNYSRVRNVDFLVRRVAAPTWSWIKPRRGFLWRRAHVCCWRVMG